MKPSNSLPQKFKKLSKRSERVKLSKSILKAPKHSAKPATPLFRSQKAIQKLREIEASNPDGTDKTWVHRVLLAWQRHYLAAHKSKEKTPSFMTFLKKAKPKG